MAAARALRLVQPVEQHVPVSAAALDRAVADAEQIANDLLAGLAAAEHRVWADSRAAAINELIRLSLRVERMRDDFTALTDRATTPPRAA